MGLSDPSFSNLDFRSLYLHFECGVWMYDSKAVLQVKQNFLQGVRTTDVGKEKRKALRFCSAFKY